MFCHKCGNKTQESSAFCHKCGARLSLPEPKVHTQANVPTSGNRKKIGIIAVIAALIPIIGVVAFFALRSGDDNGAALARAPDSTAYVAQVETPENPALPEPLETAYPASQEIQVALLLYLDHINEIISEDTWPGDEWSTMALVYIDDDDIPELVVDWGFTAGGSRVVTVSDGELVYLHGSLGGISYIERQNIFLRSGGRMGYYHNVIYAIVDGEFVILHEGHFTDMGSYSWDDEDVTHEEYFDRLHAAFDFSIASNSRVDSISAEEMIEKINALLDAELVQSGQAPATTGRANNLDERLFGAWVQQGDFPYWVILTRTFYPDGTGHLWGDGPGVTFTWHANGDVLTMDALDDFGNEWTDVLRYEIVGDTMTLTFEDGWQLVYLREYAALAIPPPGEAATPAIQPPVIAATNEVLFNGIPVLSFLDSSIWELSDLSNVFGSPNISDAASVSRTFSNEVATWMEFINDRIITIWDLNALTVNGVSLPLYREELISILGTPTFDGQVEDVWGNPMWRLEYGAIRFNFLSPAHRARNIQIIGRI